WSVRPGRAMLEGRSIPGPRTRLVMKAVVVAMAVVAAAAAARETNHRASEPLPRCPTNRIACIGASSAISLAHLAPSGQRGPAPDRDGRCRAGPTVDVPGDACLAGLRASATVLCVEARAPDLGQSAQLPVS